MHVWSDLHERKLVSQGAIYNNMYNYRELIFKKCTYVRNHFPCTLTVRGQYTSVHIDVSFLEYGSSLPGLLLKDFLYFQYYHSVSYGTPKNVPTRCGHIMYYSRYSILFMTNLIFTANP